MLKLLSILLIFLVVSISGCGRTSTLGKPSVSWTLAFHLTASQDIDGELVALANSTNDTTIVSNNRVIAAWIPVSAGKQTEIETLTDVVTRRNSAGDLEILALTSTIDVTERDLLTVASSEVEGKPIVNISLTEAGTEKMLQMTKTSNKGRYMICVVDGTTRELEEILSTVGGQLSIRGDFTQAEVDQLVQGVTYR